MKPMMKFCLFCTSSLNFKIYFLSFPLELSFRSYFRHRLRVAVPTPRGKTGGRERLRKPTQIVFCDVTVIYDVENKLSFPSGIWNMISDKDLPSVLANTNKAGPAAQYNAS